MKSLMLKLVEAAKKYPPGIQSSQDDYIRGDLAYRIARKHYKMRFIFGFILGAFGVIASLCLIMFVAYCMVDVI